MQISKTKIDPYIMGLKILNIAGPIAGICLIIGMPTVAYLQTRPQQLPITRKFTHNGQTFYLEVATKPRELQKGLKFRASLPSNQGMLFKLGDRYKNVGFWMHQVRFPLDIIYLDNGVVTTIINNAQPCYKAPCTVYFGSRATKVLELPAGKLDIKNGDKLTFKISN
ncbi:DUF192 domain-containing protein [Nodularia sp. LEGE 04288]|uniref:DUF192 domain-containing protein n=1 Tax=Nodularia sp. LEGE 04288 TaxID=1828639 RepID=UPI001D1027C1|nr:DUF192 domain-containing protein [Nodularia sp. LEGE 04288]MCC2692852.1 DUF192 domain-containing protein [Nodularia sp. LEGE 04288]